MTNVIVTRPVHANKTICVEDEFSEYENVLIINSNHDLRNQSVKAINFFTFIYLLKMVFVTQSIVIFFYEIHMIFKSSYNNII